MSAMHRLRVFGYVALAIAVVGSSAFFVSFGTAVGAPLSKYLSDSRGAGAGGPATLPESTFVSTPPAGATGPDDITLMAIPGTDEGKALVWTAFQNGINPNGTPGSSGGPTQSVVAGYDPTSGQLVRAIHVTGKVDGLTADPELGALIATVNEDDNSAFNLVYPALGAVATYAYSPSPAVGGVGGTDSIAVLHGRIYVAHSNPVDTTQATDYLVTLHRATLTAQLTPVFYDDSGATNVLTGAPMPLALTDPDTNYIMPRASPEFGGTLATVSQADGKLIFASDLKGTPELSVLNLTDNVSGNLPPVDGLAVATCGAGTLYVVDAGSNSIQALSTKGWPAGTVFVGEPNDNGNPLVGTLNLNTGVITPLGNHFTSPKGLLFVGHCGEGRGHHHPHHDRGDDDNIARLEAS